jgi:hypothetical protein
MPDTTTYYASVGGDRTVSNPYGLLRRTEHDDGPEDQALEADITWHPTPLITEWEAGNSVYELVEVTPSQADTILDYFRQRSSQVG